MSYVYVKLVHEIISIILHVNSYNIGVNLNVSTHTTKSEIISKVHEFILNIVKII